LEIEKFKIHYEIFKDEIDKNMEHLYMKSFKAMLKEDQNKLRDIPCS
jgi:hypothetical protein